MSASSTDAQAITRASKSNLALAFVSLPRERRDDITVFYAWCRVIDDIADDPGQAACRTTAAEPRSISGGRPCAQPVPGESASPRLHSRARTASSKVGLQVAHFRSRSSPGSRWTSRKSSMKLVDDLRLYCHRVASVVGLVSIAIFGCRDPLAVQYAEQLGLALQLTNILRDVGEDFSNGGRRIISPARRPQRASTSPSRTSRPHSAWQ